MLAPEGIPVLAKLLRLALFVTAFTLTFTACSSDTQTTPEPTAAEIGAAKNYASLHKTDPFDGASEDRPAENWVRAVVLSTTSAKKLGSITWSAEIVHTDGSRHTIESKGQHAAEVAKTIQPDNFIAYYEPEAKNVEFYKGNIVVIVADTDTVR